MADADWLLADTTVKMSGERQHLGAANHCTNRCQCQCSTEKKNWLQASYMGKEVI